ncbi:hypothetical protein [Micromonospora sp. KLBMP9576]|uniref:hypothetical protein n=1 Tax=Micromonospora sp. KLBMP9576 TaxID=3424769 RepID=UPI003D8BABC7
MDATEHDDLRHELRQTRHRVARLETTVLHLASLAAAGLVIVGLFLPYLAFEQYDESMLTIGFTAGREDAFFAVVFIGLLVVAVTALILLVVAGERAGSPAQERFGRIVGWLMLLSAAGASLLAMAPDEDLDAGPGAYVYASGAILTFVILAAERGRDFWVDERREKVYR